MKWTLHLLICKLGHIIIVVSSDHWCFGSCKVWRANQKSSSWVFFLSFALLWQSGWRCCYTSYGLGLSAALDPPADCFSGGFENLVVLPFIPSPCLEVAAHKCVPVSLLGNTGCMQWFLFCSMHTAGMGLGRHRPHGSRTWSSGDPSEDFYFIQATLLLHGHCLAGSFFEWCSHLLLHQPLPLLAELYQCLVRKPNSGSALCDSSKNVLVVQLSIYFLDHSTSLPTCPNSNPCLTLTSSLALLQMFTCLCFTGLLPVPAQRIVA